MIDLKKLRKDHKITQKALCTLLGMSQPHLSLVENGKLRLSEQRQTLLAEHFGDLAPYQRDEAAAEKKAEKSSKGAPRKSGQDREKQRKFDRAYMRMAAVWAELSHCNRKKVGALIVKDRKIISDGYNGTPTGFENACEDENNQTKWYVLHAEANAILKCGLDPVVRGGDSLRNHVALPRMQQAHPPGRHPARGVPPWLLGYRRAGFPPLGRGGSRTTRRRKRMRFLL